MSQEEAQVRPAVIPGWLAGATGLAAVVAGIVGAILGVAWVVVLGGVLAVAGGLLGIEAARRVLDAPVPSHAPPDEVAVPDSGVIDPVTGAFNRRYFELAVRSRILSARRQLRPLAVVAFEVASGPATTSTPVDPAPLARRIQRVLRECDTVCHLGDARFGFVLEDTNPDGAIWAVERLRRSLTTEQPQLIHRAGVACYPAHAFEAGELLGKAEDAVANARDWPQDRIEVALAD